MSIKVDNKFQSNQNRKNNKDLSFKSLALLSNPALTSGLRFLDTEKMMGVSFIDVFTAIGPRTVHDTARINPVAGTETFWRESAGLIINCLTPGLIALGYASVLAHNINKKFGIKAHKVWANNETIDKLTEVYAKNNHQIGGYVDELVEGIKGFSNGKYKAIPDAAKDEIKATFREIFEKSTTHTINKADHYKLTAKIGSAVGATENYIIEYAGKDGKKAIETTLDDFVRDSYAMGKVFLSGKVKDLGKDGIKAVADGMKSLVRGKSALGLATTLSIALSFQYLNRLKTKKTTGKEGAPIHKHFQDKDFKYVLTPQEKKKLNAGKFFAVAGLAAIALASIGTKKLKDMPKLLQFKKLYPTLDQCRLISATTFAGRLLAAEDESELKGSTVRDYFTFLSFYVVGEFVAKGYATWKNKAHNLINITTEMPKGIKNKVGWWLKDTTSKSHNEIIFEEAKKAGLDLTSAEFVKNGKMNTKAVLKKLGEEAPKRLAHCNAANIAGLGWSLLAVGIAIPAIMKKITEVTEAKRKIKLEEMKQQAKIKESKEPCMMGNISKNTPEFNRLYKAFAN